MPTVESSTRSAPCTSPPPAARIRGQGPNRIRGLRLRAATGGCKIPCANIIRYVKKHNRPHNPHILKSRRKNGPVRPESAGILLRQTGTRKHVPPYGNDRTIRTQRVPDRRPLSRRLAALHAFLEKKPRAAARQNAKSTSRILGARKRKRHPECARPEQLPHISEHRAVNGPATGTPSARTSGPNAKSPSRDTVMSRERPLGDGFLHRSYRMSISSSR